MDVRSYAKVEPIVLTIYEPGVEARREQRAGRARPSAAVPHRSALGGKRRRSPRSRFSGRHRSRAASRNARRSNPDSPVRPASPFVERFQLRRSVQERPYCAAGRDPTLYTRSISSPSRRSASSLLRIQGSARHRSPSEARPTEGFRLCVHVPDVEEAVVRFTQMQDVVTESMVRLTDPSD